MGLIRLSPPCLPPNSHLTQKAALPGPVPAELLLVLLYVLLGNWPVFAYLPPLGHFTTLSNRRCSLWCTSGLDLACQSPFARRAYTFLRGHQLRLPGSRLLLGVGPSPNPQGVSTLHLLLGFSTVYTFISPKRRNFEEKKAREGARTVKSRKQT